MRFRRNLVLLGALGGITIALPASADQPSEYQPPCDASKVSRADVDRAHTVFLSGKQFLEESNYDKAISYFKDAYSIDCSVHAMLPIIATAYERKGDKAEAVRALDEYLKRAPNSSDHDVIERRIKNLHDQIARDQAAASAAAPAASAPPVAPSPPPPVPEAAPPPSSSAPPPAAPPAHEREGHTALPWVFVGVGGATFLTGLVIYAVGAGDISNALNQCKGVRMPCPSQTAVDQGNSGRTLEQIGGPVIGVGLVLAAAGLVWHFLEKPEDTSGSATAVVRLTPIVAHGYEGVTLGASF